MALNLTKNENIAVTEFKDKLLALLPKEVESITLFGSKARGEKSAYSDIDILVIVKKETLDLWDKIQAISSEVSLKFNVLLSVKIMDLSHIRFLEQIQSGFIRNVTKDGASIWKAA